MKRIFLTIIICLSAYTSLSFSQEVNVAPDINKGYKSADLDVEGWEKRFSGESREVYVARLDIIAAVGIQEGDKIADIGAGTGLFTKSFAEAVGPGGVIYSVDIAQKFLDLIDTNAAKDGLTNVKTVLGTDKVSNLETESVDIVFLSDVYHHFEFPITMTQNLADILTPQGDMYLIDFQRIPGVTSPERMEHVRAGKEMVIEEIETAGFSLVEEINMPSLSENYMLHFRKK